MKVLAWSISLLKITKFIQILYSTSRNVNILHALKKSTCMKGAGQVLFVDRRPKLKVKVFTSCHTPLSSIVNRRSTLLGTFRLCFQSKRTLWWCLRDTACGVIPVCNENNRFGNSLQTNLSLSKLHARRNRKSEDRPN